MPLGDLDGAMLGAVKACLDRRGLQLVMSGADHADHRQASCQLHAAMLSPGRLLSQAQSRVVTALTSV